MKLKLNENLPREAAVALLKSGFEAQTVWEEGLSGATDDLLADVARRETRVLLQQLLLLLDCVSHIKNLSQK